MFERVKIITDDEKLDEAADLISSFMYMAFCSELLNQVKILAEEHGKISTEMHVSLIYNTMHRMNNKFIEDIYFFILSVAKDKFDHDVVMNMMRQLNHKLHDSMEKRLSETEYND